MNNTFSVNQAQFLPTQGLHSINTLSVIEVTGPDAQSFLQGQLSCDVTELKYQQYCLGTHNTPKGRMISSFRVFKFSNENETSFWIVLNQDLVEIALQALKKYSVFSKVELIQNTDLNFFLLNIHAQEHAFLEESQSCLESLELTTSLFDIQPESFAKINHGLIANLELKHTSHTTEANSFLIIGDSNRSLSLDTLLNENTATSTDELLRVQHQQELAFIEQSTTDLLIAQMLNYQSTSAVSFTKGCYTGQEIIARSEYKGKVKRLLCHLIVSYDDSNASALTVGCELKISLADKETAKSAGYIASLIPSKINPTAFDILCVLSTTAIDTIENTPT